MGLSLFSQEMSVSGLESDLYAVLVFQIRNNVRVASFPCNMTIGSYKPLGSAAKVTAGLIPSLSEATTVLAVDEAHKNADSLETPP